MMVGSRQKGLYYLILFFDITFPIMFQSKIKFFNKMDIVASESSKHIIKVGVK